MQTAVNFITHYIAKPVLPAAALTATLSCGGNAPTPPDELYTIYEGTETIVFDSHLVNCSYMGFHLVLLGCLPSQTDNSRISRTAAIGGLKLEWGYTYELEVSFWRTTTEVADGPQVVSSLERLISKTPDPIGEIYILPNQSPKFTFDYGANILGYSYECGLDEGCSWLEPSLEYPVDLTFQLGENREFILIDATATAPTP